MLTSDQLRNKYLTFFGQRGHVVIPGAPLVPENDPTTLLVSSGMQPLLPYFLGQPHPAGTRLVDSQPSIRAHGFHDDTEEVGDNRHTTFFEMLGNWSLGDYFKKEQLAWFFEFLTSEVGLDPKKLYMSVFQGDEAAGVPKDTESAAIWQELFAKKNIEAKVVELGTEENGAKLGMQGGRIFYYGVKKNWWSRSGPPSNMPAGEPGGPDSEVFYEFTQIEHDPKYGEYCHPNCDCGRFLEIGNSVFMQYLKQEDGSFKELPKKNVDFGGGFERILAASLNNPDVFSTDLYQPLIQELETHSQKKYEGENLKSMRVIADHLKAATFLIAQGVVPGNKGVEYILRRFLRRAAVKMYQLGGGLTPIAAFEGASLAVAHMYKNVDEKLGFSLNPDELKPKLEQVISEELTKFGKTLDKGLKEITKAQDLELTNEFAFNLFQTYGFPFELTKELAGQKGKELSKEEFNTLFQKHQVSSRTASQGMFKGGLGGNSEQIVKYHTATHLLHQALRDVLGAHVAQKGSNITDERLRFDFVHDSKLTETQIKEVEDIVNQKISLALPVSFEIMPKEQAEQSGALHFFGEKYQDSVKVYFVGESLASAYSKEFCGGPHVANTSELGKFKIIKEEAVSQGVRRIKAILV